MPLIRPRDCLRALAFLVLALIGVFSARAAETVTYLHNDAFGNPVLATDAGGGVLWRESYRPYGERLKNEAASAPNRQWFAGKPQDVETGLSYFGARYYDPVVGRFMGVDPQGFEEKNPQSFNRYAYGNNNPYKFIDRDGRASVLVWGGLIVAGGFILINSYRPDLLKQFLGGRKRGDLGDSILHNESSDKGSSGGSDSSNSSGEGKSPQENTSAGGQTGNTNPYSGPVDRPVIVVDPKGNAIPVGRGEKLTASPNGDYQQVRDRRGVETGVRLDRGGHRTNADPQARDPHAHVPGVTTPEGNPHLPTRQ